MLHIFYIILVCITMYILLSLFLTYLIHRLPRSPISQTPDWGQITDTRVSTPDGGYLEVWSIEPPSPVQSKGVILFAHGWGSNRDTMVNRARIFANLGYKVVIHSSRDHGSSSSKKIVSSIHFSEDIETVLKWIGESVILYGYSAGAVGSIMTARKYPHLIKVLFLEACFANSEKALLSFYNFGNKYLGTIFGYMIVFWLKVLYGERFKQTHPEKIAPNLPMPVMLIHGEQDQQFPLHMAIALKNSFKQDQMVEMHIALGKDHGESIECPKYKPAIINFLEKIEKI